MKVLEVVTGRASRLMRLMHPQGALPIPRLIQFVQERYKFEKLPEDLAQVYSDKIAIFEHGQYSNRYIKRLLLGDGFFACDVHGTTDAADELADDLEYWAINELGYQRKEDGVLGVAYASELEVSFVPSESAILNALVSIGRSIGNHVISYGNSSPAYSLERISLVPDPAENQMLRAIPFVLERRVGIQFSNEIWYSAAPLRTNDHIALLSDYAALYEKGKIELR